MPWLDFASWILQACSWTNLHAWHFAIESSPEELSHAQRTLEVKFSRTEVEFSARPSDPSLRMSSSVHVAAVGRKEGSDHPLLQRTIQQSWRENKLYFLKGVLKSVQFRWLPTKVPFSPNLWSHEVKWKPDCFWGPKLKKVFREDEGRTKFAQVWHQLLGKSLKFKSRWLDGLCARLTIRVHGFNPCCCC